MVESVSDDVEVRLDELLAARARSASDGRLVVDVIAGAAVMAAALIWHPPGWVVLSSAGSCFLAFGVWGILDRVLRERLLSRERESIIYPVDDAIGGRHGDRLTPILRVGRIVAVVVGAAGALLLLLSLSATALGRWIS